MSSIHSIKIIKEQDFRVSRNVIEIELKYSSSRNESYNELHIIIRPIIVNIDIEDLYKIISSHFEQYKTNLEMKKKKSRKEYCAHK